MLPSQGSVQWWGGNCIRQDNSMALSNSNFKADYNYISFKADLAGQLPKKKSTLLLMVISVLMVIIFLAETRRKTKESKPDTKVLASPSKGGG